MEIYPGLKLETEVEFLVKHIGGGRSTYWYEVDFKTMAMRLMDIFHF